MWQKIKLFILSLWLLFFLLFIYTVQVPICLCSDYEFVGIWTLIHNNIIPIICIMLMIIGIIFYKIFDYKVIKGAPDLPQTVIKIKDINYETVTFLITYIIPLLFFVVGTDLSIYRNFILLILVLLIIGIIYCKTNMFYSNPTLAILGFHVYQIETKVNEEMIVIIKGKLHVNDDFYPTLIDDNIYFITRGKNDKF